jgi:hypothetical protein
MILQRSSGAAHEQSGCVSAGVEEHRHRKVSFHLVGYTFGTLAFALISWSLRRRRIDLGRDTHLKTLIPIYFFPSVAYRPKLANMLD